MRLVLVCALLASCSKSSEKPAPAPTQGSAAVVAAPDAALPDAPVVIARDPEIEAMLKAGTTCKKLFGKLTHGCAEYDKIGTAANAKQGSPEVATTCAAYLSDPDANKRLLAAQCLWSMNAAGKTPVMGIALDALEAEKDPAVRQEIAWGIMSAEAVTAGLTDRVLALVDTLLADLKANDKTAGYLFDSLFPQYFIGDAVKAPPHALLAVVRDFDKTYDLGEDTRKKLAAAVKASRRLEDDDWGREQVDKTVKQLTAPREAK